MVWRSRYLSRVAASAPAPTYSAPTNEWECSVAQECWLRSTRAAVLCPGLSTDANVQVMESNRMPFTEAIRHVESRRCCIDISAPLHNQLREFETIYQGRSAAPAPRTGWDQKKRGFEPGEESAMQME